jgi:hypothetical protein
VEFLDCGEFFKYLDAGSLCPMGISLRKGRLSFNAFSNTLEESPPFLRGHGVAEGDFASKGHAEKFF